MRIESAKKVFGAVFRNLFFFRRFLSFFNQFSVSNLSFFTIRPHMKVVVWHWKTIVLYSFYAKERRKKSVDKRGRSNHPRAEAQAQQNLGNRLPSRRVRHPYDSRPFGNLAGVVFRQSLVRLRLRAQRRRRCVYDVLLQLDKRQRKRCSRYNTPHSFVLSKISFGYSLMYEASKYKQVNHET